MKTVEQVKNRRWTEKEVLVLRTSYADSLNDALADRLGRTPNQVAKKANSLGLRKSSAFMSAINARWTGNNPDNPGIETRFRKGCIPWNKGLRGLRLGGDEHRFKKGQRIGKANHSYRAIGSERITKDGYLERKINDDLPMQNRWRAVHLLLWESEHGPIPDGHVVIFRDGNKQNVCLENLQLISRADLMRKNSVQKYGREIYLLLQLLGAVTRQINQRNRKDV